MAIIPTSLEAIIVNSSRPLIRIRDNHLEIEEDSQWSDILAANNRIIDATHAVGRIETSDSSLPYVGTAFLIEKSIAITTDYNASTLDNAEKSWINFSNDPNASKERAEVIKIDIYPKSGLAVLYLDNNLDITPLQMHTDRPTLDNEKVVTIGFPGIDFRNDQDFLRKMFGSHFGVKRVSPGRILEEGKQQYNHDCSTTGGSGGSPLILLETGQVVGVHYSGHKNEFNFAKPISGLANIISKKDLVDPKSKITIIDEDDEMLEGVGFRGSDIQNSHGSVSDEERIARVSKRFSIDQKPSDDRKIFTLDEFWDLCDLSVRAGLATDTNILAIFTGLPLDLVASLNTRSNAPPATKLSLRLQDLNMMAFALSPNDQKVPFYYVLKAAKFNAAYQHKNAFDVYIEKAENYKI